MKPSAMTRGAGAQTAGSSGWRIYAVAAVVAGGLTAGAYELGVQPLLESHAEERGRIAELESRHHKAAELSEGLHDWERRLTNAKEALSQTPLRLQPAALVNQRLALVTHLASDSGLTIDEVLPGAPVDGALYQTVPIVLIGNGPYPACAAFLHELRERFPDTGIDSFESANKDPKPEQTSGSFRFELTWFTAPPLKK
jgi:Tfp pilus assembly protein PilO